MTTHPSRLSILLYNLGVALTGFSIIVGILWVLLGLPVSAAVAWCAVGSAPLGLSLMLIRETWASKGGNDT